MNNIKKFYYLIFASIILISCNSNNSKQFDNAGGKISLSIDNEPSTFISRDVSDVYSANVLSQVMEGLVSLDPKDLSVVPQIASSWKVSSDGLTYDFTIRKDVKFHPHSVFKSDDERNVTTNDIKKTIEYICSNGEVGNPGTAYTFVFEKYLVGAKEFNEGKTESIEGLMITENLVSFKLTEKDNNFLNKLANISCAIMPAKIIEEGLEQDMIGSGPFIFREFIKGESNSILLTKNEDYYVKDEKGNALPYLDSIEFIIEANKTRQLEFFESKKVDLIRGLPASKITEMLEGRISDFNSNPPLLVLHNNPILTTHYYYFNMNDERFKNEKVRKAFNYAIDKSKIGSEILRNQYAELGDYGIVPPIENAFKGYDFDEVKKYSYSYDPEKAKKLLAEAGYPNGQGFGTVTLRLNISDLHASIADEFAKQIQSVLGINVNIDASSFDQLEKDSEKGNYQIARNGWAGDYISPETFLFNFYGRAVPTDKSKNSVINKSRYVNPDFDRYFEQAKQSDKLIDQINFFEKAEVELMKNPPMIPLWYKGDYGIVYSNVRNLYFNPLFLFNFTRVYKKEWTKEEFQEKMKQKS
jgi:oligopeptide transport system substrate-binding protein